MNKPGYYYNTYNDTFFIIFNNNKVIVDACSMDNKDVSWYESVIPTMFLKKHENDLFLGCL